MEEEEEEGRGAQTVRGGDVYEIAGRRERKLLLEVGVVAVELVALGEDDHVREDEHVPLLHDAAAAVDEAHVKLRLELARRRCCEVLLQWVESLRNTPQCRHALRLLLARALFLIQLVTKSLYVLQSFVNAVGLKGAMQQTVIVVLCVELCAQTKANQGGQAACICGAPS